MTTDFGKDIFCLDSLRTGTYATGVKLVAQRCYHRLITPRGQLRGGEDEANFGFDLAGLVGSVAQSTGSIEGRVKNELLKDPEVLTVDCTVTRGVSGVGATYTLEVSVTTAEGPFELVIAVSDVTVELLGLEAS